MSATDNNHRKDDHFSEVDNYKLLFIERMITTERMKNENRRKDVDQCGGSGSVESV